MARPHLYKQLDRILINGQIRETVALGFDSMYGVKKGDLWVTLCKEDTYKLINDEVNRKYTRLFFATERVAQTHAKKLNLMFHTDEYRAVKI